MSFDDRGTTGPVYSEVMEDYDVVADAVTLAKGEVAVIVSSAGDNVFNAALESPSAIHAIDVSAAQTSFCRLKEAALQALDARGFAELVGTLEASPDRRGSLLDRLPEERVQAVLAGSATREVALAYGLAACGGMAAFVAPLREGLAARVGADELREILTSPDRARRRELWSTRFDTAEVADFLTAGLNEDTIPDELRPRAAFDQDGETPFAVFYMGVLRHLLLDLDPTTNPFLHRLWLGTFPSPESVPPYLRRENHARLRERAPVARWHTQDLGEFLGTQPDASVDVFNLSNIADWMNADDFDALWREVDRVARPGARAFFRSFLADRPLPAGVVPGWGTDARRNVALARADRVGYFARCEVWTRAGGPAA